MSDILNIGVSSLHAYQSALDVTSQNIANANTDGYVKRSADLKELNSGNGLQSGGKVPGLGVNVAGLSRAADQFRSAQVRGSQADLSRTNSGIGWMEQVDSALSNHSLSDALSGFFASAQTLAADPTGAAPRSAMLEAASGLANAFSVSGRALDSAASELDATTMASIGDLNNYAAALGKVNASLGRTGEGSGQRLSLLDQRDTLLEKMSSLVDVSVTFDDTGRAAVRAGGGSGPTLVSGAASGVVSASRNSSGALSFAVQGPVTGISLLSPVGGTLAGLADGAGTITAAQASLKKIASGLVGAVNAQQAAGVDLDGDPGAPMFALSGDGTAQISLTLGDPAKIAAASPGGGNRGNGNLKALAGLRQSGGYEAGVTGLIAANGSALAGRRMVASAQGSIRDNAVSARDQISGVDLDQEAVDLIKFQQAYQASSRVIQVARDTFQSLLNIG